MTNKKQVIYHESARSKKDNTPEWRRVKCARFHIMIPPDTQRMFAQRMNAITINIDTRLASYIAHPDEIAQLILNATPGSNGLHCNS